MARRPDPHVPQASEPGLLPAARSAVLCGLLLTLSLGSTAVEIAAALAALVAIAVLLRGERPDPGPLARPAALLALGWMAMSLAQEGHPVESARRVWGLAPVVLVPVLHAGASPLPFARLLVLGAVPAALVGGLHDHHLSWAYSGCVLAIAAWGTGYSWVAAVLAVSVASTGALGGVVALAVGIAVCETDRRFGGRGSAAAAVGGVGATLAALWLLPWDRALTDRVVLWTGGAQVLADGGAAPGSWRVIVDGYHQALEPTFFFPHHAHDAYIQAAAEAGPAAWIALGWVCWIVWSSGPGWLRGALAALLVGAMTQDVHGDLEVLRTAVVVGALALAGGLEPARRNADGSTMSIASEETHVDVAAGGPGPG